jgi:hypothetical protein
VQLGRQTANRSSIADVQRYCWHMAMLPAKPFVRALAVGLVLVGAALAGPAPLGAAHVGMSAFEAPPPPTPDPIPIIDKPANPGPNNESPPRHRRHIDGDPNIGR